MPQKTILNMVFIFGTYFHNGSMHGPSGNHVGALLLLLLLLLLLSLLLLLLLLLSFLVTNITIIISIIIIIISIIGIVFEASMAAPGFQGSSTGLRTWSLSFRFPDIRV